MPVDVDVVYTWVQARIDVISLVSREDDVSSVTTFVEGLEDCRDIVGGVIFSWKDRTSGALIVVCE